MSSPNYSSAAIREAWEKAGKQRWDAGPSAAEFSPRLLPLFRAHFGLASLSPLELSTSTPGGVGGPSISSLGWVGPFGPRPAAEQILEIEIHGWPAVLEADLERAAAGDGFIALSGGRWACPMIPPIKPGGKPLGIEAA
jgi:hypothetical protein